MMNGIKLNFIAEINSQLELSLMEKPPTQITKGHKVTLIGPTESTLAGLLTKEENLQVPSKISYMNLLKTQLTTVRLEILQYITA